MTSTTKRQPHAELVETTRTFVLDCDGVIWRGNQLIEGIAEVLDYLRAAGKRLVFLTNNSTKTRQQQVDKFHRLGLTWVQREDVLTSAYAAALLLKRKLKLPTDKKVYVVGHEGIVDEMTQLGYTCVGADEHACRTPDLKQGLSVDPDIGAVVCGFDLHFNYWKMVYATQCVLTLPGCEFVATNCDALSHVVSDAEWPGGGTMVAALQHALGRAPIVAGKPSEFLVELLVETCGEGAGPEHMCMVGDRLDTDIAFGHQGGMRTLLVYTGVTAKGRLETELQRLNVKPPHHTADSLANLLLA
ncbi:hypothetical protein PTSG_05957 [Salpingoeca rosetta]|uniref:Phosphoglycolate phosphatase n=1 Tax=Salpingoeca rosetta (strain ATCC 50818 / BSB-021) TaxID=946362 RepID=F2UD97_SALR5|nr:uncharacterized protein PTSG_05957 [Salpingoeca rosetta]EGD74592.1 hypothetical protein PTSG_05957 [Salpingoeca rosetta]|eukprot:XP_004992849.1 hypothetical protein PTSG_05957 [Salpingoeca rosetta]